MIRAPLWQVAEKAKPVPMKFLNVQRLLGTEITKSRVVPAAAGVTGDFKTVEQQDPFLPSQTITRKATRIAALLHEPPKRFLENDKNLIVINGDIFEHLDPETMCPAWLYEEMARADTLICGSQLLLTTCTTFWTRKQRGVSTMVSTRRAWVKWCIFPFSVGQPNQRQQGILHWSTLPGC